MFSTEFVDFSHLERKGEIAQRIRIMEGTEPPTEQQAQIEQFQAEMAIRQAQLEIAKLEAEITKLQSEAALNTAKAQDTAQVDPQIKIAELQTKLQSKREELELRHQLSQMTNDMRREQTEIQAASKIAVAAMKPPTGGK